MITCVNLLLFKITPAEFYINSIKGLHRKYKYVTRTWRRWLQIKVLFVIDEAYIDFTDSISPSIDLLEMHQNLIIVKSMTKNYAIPGLRLGYLITNKEIVRNIESYSPPWTVIAGN